jgi:hypothetical protein
MKLSRSNRLGFRPLDTCTLIYLNLRKQQSYRSSRTRSIVLNSSVVRFPHYGCTGGSQSGIGSISPWYSPAGGYSCVAFWRDLSGTLIHIQFLTENSLLLSVFLQ